MTRHLLTSLLFALGASLLPAQIIVGEPESESSRKAEAVIVVNGEKIRLEGAEALDPALMKKLRATLLEALPEHEELVDRLLEDLEAARAEAGADAGGARRPRPGGGRLVRRGKGGFPLRLGKGAKAGDRASSRSSDSSSSSSSSSESSSSESSDGATSQRRVVIRDGKVVVDEKKGESAVPAALLERLRDLGVGVDPKALERLRRAGGAKGGRLRRLEFRDGKLVLDLEKEEDASESTPRRVRVLGLGGARRKAPEPREDPEAHLRALEARLSKLRAELEALEKSAGGR